jgi:hypothetical protein
MRAGSRRDESPLITAPVSQDGERDCVRFVNVGVGFAAAAVYARRGFESRLRLSVKSSIALVAIGLALAGAGCFGDDDDEQPAQGRTPLKLVANTVVEGGPRRERALLRRAVGGMEKTALTRVSIGPPRGRREGEAGAAVPVTFTPVRGASVRRRWEEWIVAGAFSRRLLAAGLPAEVDGSDPESGFTAKPKLPRQPDPRPLSRAQEAGGV